MQTYDELLAKLKLVKERGWTKTHRKGPTGIGKTLEDLLGIEENNVPGPDGEKLELKSGRKSDTRAGSMLTLFTKSPDDRGANSVMLDRLGYRSYPGSPSKELHTTVNAVDYNTLRGKRGLKIVVTNERVEVVGAPVGDRSGSTRPIDMWLEDQPRLHEPSEDEVYCYWSAGVIQQTFERKLPRLLYVKADWRGTGENEEFWFNEAQLLEDGTFDNFKHQLEAGNILVDIRIGQWPPGHPQAGEPHDHGTGFRVFPRNLPLCFSRRTDVL